MRKLFALFFVAIVLSSCVPQEVTITHQRTLGRYRTTEIQWVGGGRDFKGVIQNNPFQVSDAELERIIWPIVSRSITFMRTNVTSTPNETRRPGFRVELFFFAPTNIGGDTLCEPPRGGLPAPQIRTDELVILGALCLRGNVLTTARATTGYTQPGEDRFERAIVQLTRTLFPRVRENRRRACRPPHCR